MTEEQRSSLWAFARGDTTGPQFEQWLFDQTDLEIALGEDFHLELLSADYADRDKVWKLREGVRVLLVPDNRCECVTIRDMSAIPMGGDFYFEKVFETLDRVVEYGPDKWWLYISECHSCQTNWLVAQDERIYDEFFLKRLSKEQVQQAKAGLWPTEFQTYEDVLAIGRKHGAPPIFLEPMSISLVCTAADLIKERPSIRASEIAYLLGVSERHVKKLVKAAENEGVGNRG